MYICMYLCMYVCIYAYESVRTRPLYSCTHTHTYILYIQGVSIKCIYIQGVSIKCIHTLNTCKGNIYKYTQFFQKVK